MLATYRISALIIAVPLVVLNAGAVQAGDSLPNPVKSCEDARAYVGADNSMTMDTFKKLLIASGQNLDGSGEQALDKQCKVAAVVRNVLLSQHIMTKPDGSEIRAETRVIDENGVCKLVNVSIAGC